MNRVKLCSWTIIFVVLVPGAWSKTIIAAEYDIIADGKLASDGAVVGRSTGRIWSLQNRNSDQVHENQTKAGFGEGSGRVFITSSDDDGKTWAKAKDITRSAKEKYWSCYATGPGAGIQLRRGKHKGRLIIPRDHKSLPEGGPQIHHSHILYGDDHGETS